MNVPAAALSLDEFLDWENAQPTRNEFHRGVVLPTGDMTRREAVVGNNLARHLGSQLGTYPCQVFAYSMKVQIGHDTILYPDVSVTCDKADLRT